MIGGGIWEGKFISNGIKLGEEPIKTEVLRVSGREKTIGKGCEGIPDMYTRKNNILGCEGSCLLNLVIAWSSKRTSGS